jgi:hypothetical protein
MPHAPSKRTAPRLRPFRHVPLPQDLPLAEWPRFDSPAQHPAPLKDGGVMPSAPATGERDDHAPTGGDANGAGQALRGRSLR